MAQGVYSNFEALEGTVDGETTVSFIGNSRRITLMNDSATKDLNFRFHDGAEAATLKATESISLDFFSRAIIIDGDFVPYRIWVSG